MVAESLNLDGGVVFATLSMVTVSLNLDGRIIFITLFSNLSMVTVFRSICNFVLRKNMSYNIYFPFVRDF